MSLDKAYPVNFQKIWDSYPKHPRGRSVKTDAFSAYQKVSKDLEFTDKDIEDILTEIDTQKRKRESWQKGHQHGPQGLQVWIRAHGWNAEYNYVKKQQIIQENQISDHDNNVAYVRDQIRRGAPIPAFYEQYRAEAERVH